MNESKATSPITIQNTNDGIPSIFADGATGIMQSAQVVKFNMFSDIHLLDSPTPGQHELARSIVARIVMTPQNARALGTWLLENVSGE